MKRGEGGRQGLDQKQQLDEQEEMDEKHGAGASKVALPMTRCEHVSRDPVVPQVKADCHSLNQ